MSDDMAGPPHPWRIVADNERQTIRWCPQCGALWKWAKVQHEGVWATVAFAAMAGKRQSQERCAGAGRQEVTA